MPTTYAIPNGSTAFAATIWTSAGGTETISNAVNGVSFQPDFLWMKNRSIAQNNYLVDSNRGTSKVLVSNTTSAEITDATFVTAFNSNGFSLGAGGFTATQAIVGWQWKANGAAVTNTAGSITSQVSANTAAGFSVVTYTGNEVAGATVGHGLGVAPSMIIVKRRDGAAVDWAVYHASIGATKYLTLNTTAAEGTSSAYWNNTAPTSSVFSLNNSGSTNANPRLFVAYCFAAVAGYSAFGSYTGNGSADGPFLYMGFRPRWLLTKRTDSTSDWTIIDTSVNTYNVASFYQTANKANAQETYAGWDVLSNGIKFRNTDAGINGSGATYIYACFAETAFKFANAR